MWTALEAKEPSEIVPLTGGETIPANCVAITTMQVLFVEVGMHALKVSFSTLGV